MYQFLERKRFQLVNNLNLFIHTYIYIHKTFIYSTIIFIYKGEDVTKAEKYKLIGNFFIGGVIEILSEGLTLADKNDISRDKVMEFVNNFLPTKSFQIYG